MQGFAGFANKLGFMKHFCETGDYFMNIYILYKYKHI